MNRLTTYQPTEGGIPYVIVKDEQEALQKLARYEDTKWEPNEILTEMKIAHKNNQLLAGENLRLKDEKETAAKPTLADLSHDIANQLQQAADNESKVMIAATNGYSEGYNRACEDFAREIRRLRPAPKPYQPEGK